MKTIKQVFLWFTGKRRRPIINETKWQGNKINNKGAKFIISQINFENEVIKVNRCRL